MLPSARSVVPSITGQLWSNTHVWRWGWKASQQLTSQWHWLLISYFLQDSKRTSEVTACPPEVLCRSFSLGTAPTHESPPSKWSSLFGKFQLKCWEWVWFSPFWGHHSLGFLTCPSAWPSWGSARECSCLPAASVRVGCSLFWSSQQNNPTLLFFLNFTVAMDLLIFIQHS